MNYGYRSFSASSVASSAVDYQRCLAQSVFSLCETGWLTSVSGGEDLVRRDFAAAAPNRLWTADITYVGTDESFLYLAFVLDAYSRKLVGWAMKSHLRTELVVDAVEVALRRRRPTPSLIHHSDQGVQYAALSFGKRLEQASIIPSMGRAGSALDNAISESFVATLKAELVSRSRFSSREAEDGNLRVLGGFLQPEEATFLARLQKPRRLRGR